MPNAMVIALSFALGILGMRLWDGTLWFGLFAGLFCIGFAFWDKKQGVKWGVIIFSLFLGCGSYLIVRTSSLHSPCLVLSGHRVVLQGKVVGQVKRTKRGGSRWLMQCDSLHWAERSYYFPHRVCILSREDLSALREGCYLRLLVRIRPVQSMNGDFKTYLQKQNVMYVGTLQRVVQLQNPKGWFQKVRYGIANYLRKVIKDTTALALAYALFLADRHLLTKEMYQTFQATGTAHLLAVSGLHVGILLSFVFLILRLGHFIGLYKQHGYWLGLIAIVMFVGIVGTKPSVVRAAVMTSLWIVAKLLGRKIQIWHVIGLAMLLLLVYNPLWLFDVGFQLSFAAVIGIVAWFRPLRAYFPKEPKVLGYLIDLMIVSLCAQIATLPFTLYYFGTFPTYFLIANLIAVPLGFVIVYSGLLMLLFSFIPLISGWIAAFYSYSVQGLLWALKQIASLPWSLITVPQGSMHWVLWSVVGIMLWQLVIWILQGRFGRIHWRLSFNRF